MKPIKKRFRKYCLTCDKLFRPSGKACKYCDDCLEKKAVETYLRIKETKNKK